MSDHLTGPIIATSKNTSTLVSIASNTGIPTCIVTSNKKVATKYS